MTQDIYSILLHSTLILGICYIFYLIVLANNSSFRFRRIFLLLSLFFSVILPPMDLKVLPYQVNENSHVQYDDPSKKNGDSAKAPVIQNYDPDPSKKSVFQNENLHENAFIEKSDVLILLYFSISFFLLFLFLSRIISFSLLISRAEKSTYKASTVYLTNSEKIIGASFFGKMIINKKFYEKEEFEIIFQHEKQHSMLLHSLDILFVELYNIFFWINPISWIIKKEIRCVHEYECDQKTLGSISLKKYIMTLLSFSTDQAKQAGWHTFARGQMKKRIDQLVQTPFHNTTYIKFLTGIVFLLVFMGFGCSKREDPGIRPEIVGSDKVRTITTRFIGKQSDLKNKHDRIISKVQFDSEGNIIEAKTFMDYPYNYDRPQPIELLATPSVEQVNVLMDGLSLEIAEKALVYGRNWPITYLNYIENNGHPKTRNYPQHVKTDIKRKKDLPEKILLSEDVDGISYEWYFRYTEKFEYDNQDRIIKHIEYSGEEDSNDHPFATDRYTEFSYKNDQIDKISNGRVSFRPIFEGEKLTGLVKYINQTVMNIRKYYYHENGLKRKTEMYNRNGDLEYIVKYEYKFFEDLPQKRN
mgnify:CR=1 FL=1